MGVIGEAIEKGVSVKGFGAVSRDLDFPGSLICKTA